MNHEPDVGSRNPGSPPAISSVLKSKNGLYYGTTRGGSWWRRHAKGGWFSRGNAEIWLDAEGFHFRRYLTSETKTIPLKAIRDVSLGRWHAGKWTGAPVIKIAWKEGDLDLVSGFSVSREKEEAKRWVAEIAKRVERGST